jgi:hypothetical protein
MTTKEAVALLERYSNYDGMGIPNLAGCKEAMRVAVDALKEACPELAESEDERIRKELIEAFEVYDIESSWNLIPVKHILAWLEKRNIEKIRQEIERMHQQAVLAACGNDTDWLRSRIATCVDILAFIDSLPEETCKESLHVSESCQENGNKLPRYYGD